MLSVQSCNTQIQCFLFQLIAEKLLRAVLFLNHRKTVPRREQPGCIYTIIIYCLYQLLLVIEPVKNRGTELQFYYPW